MPWSPTAFSASKWLCIPDLSIKTKSSLQRPPSQYAIARQIFWSEVLNYPCHLKLCKLLEGLLLPRLILFSWWNFFIEDFTHAYSVFWQVYPPHFLLSNSSPIPAPLFSPNFLTLKNCSLNHLKISYNLFWSYSPPISPIIASTISCSSISVSSVLKFWF